MMKTRSSAQKTLPVLLLVYGVASLIHFAHNAEFLADYPNLPDSWNRAGVYLAWAGLTIIGIVGWILLNQGCRLFGFLVLAVYAGLGLDSLGHYVVAPMSEHTVTMNLTILFEVGAAGFVLGEIMRQLSRQMLQRNFRG